VFLDVILHSVLFGTKVNHFQSFFIGQAHWGKNHFFVEKFPNLILHNILSAKIQISFLTKIELFRQKLDFCSIVKALLFHPMKMEANFLTLCKVVYVSSFCG